MSYNWGSYAAPTTCKPAIPQGAKSLLAYLIDRFPWVFSMGICNCRGSTGGSGLSHHANCRAVDLGIPTTPSGGYISKYGDPIIELLGPHGKRLGLDHLILNRIIYSATSPSGRYYSGPHPHYDHAHTGLTVAGATNLNYATLVAVLGDPAGGAIMLPILVGTDDEDQTALADLLNQTYGSNLKLVDPYNAAMVAVVKANLGKYTGHPQWKEGKGVGGKQYSRLLQDHAKKFASAPPPASGVSEARVKQLIAQSKIVP